MITPEILAKSEYGNFVLKKFRDDAAALCKYLIRAREKSEPGFLGKKAAYEKWRLSNIREDRESAVLLLRKAVVLVGVLDAHMVSMGGSGGVRLKDPLAKFKFNVAGFADESALKEAIDALNSNQQVQWKGLANWDQLSAIRNVLDSIPSEGDSDPIPRPPVAESFRVKLFGFGDDPQAIIDQKPKAGLTEPQYNVVRALLEAKDSSLKKSDLVKKSRHTDAVGILRRVAKKDDWELVVVMAGRPGGRYRIC